MDEVRVLLLDDHAIVRSGIRMLLEQDATIRVVAEGDGRDDVLSLVRRYEPHVILLDMEMPGKSGVEIAGQLQAAGVGARVLALSAYDDEQYIINLLSHGAAGYLTKEEAPQTILEAVRGVAQGEEGWLSRTVAARMAAYTRRAAKDPVRLTEREEEVLGHLAKGWPNSRIADELVVSERTVRFHLTNIYEKLGVSSRAEAISWVLSQPR